MYDSHKNCRSSRATTGRISSVKALFGSGHGEVSDGIDELVAAERFVQVEDMLPVSSTAARRIANRAS